jgi:predicted nucleic acid-binding protein
LILVDSSVWIWHLRQVDLALARLLDAEEVLTHPFVVGELAMGSLPRRAELLAGFYGLPRAVVATDEEVMAFIEQEHLFGFGLGYIDVHLLASARLTPDARLWSRDRRLADTARRLGVAPA